MIPSNDTLRFYLRHKSEFDKSILDVLSSGYYVLGPNVKKFEKSFAESVGSKFCVGVDNGTNAIKIGIQALGIGAGDEVIVQANTYIATVLGVTANRATPVFIDADEFYNIDSSQIEAKISDKTKAILVTHLYGQATRMDKILSLCKKYNLYLLEDCAQAHYAKFQNKFVGTFGDLGFFSFYPTKNLGGFGDGGAITTNRSDLFEKVMMLRNYGSKQRYNFELENGSNSRLDEIQAALLLVKLNYNKEIIEEKNKIANYYLNNIKNEYVQLPLIADGSSHVWHLFVIRVDDQQRFVSYMDKKGIKIDIHYPIPPHLSKSLSSLGYKEGDFERTEYFSKHIVDLPIFNGLTESELEEIVEAINSYV